MTEDDIQRTENETTKNVALVWPCVSCSCQLLICHFQIEKILKMQSGPINLFRFIVNPNDFGQTVENLFYVSFLIREGKCALEFSEDMQEPIICRADLSYKTLSTLTHLLSVSCERPTEDDYKNGARKQQIIMELDMDTWKVCHKCRFRT